MRSMPGDFGAGFGGPKCRGELARSGEMDEIRMGKTLILVLRDGSNDLGIMGLLVGWRICCFYKLQIAGRLVIGGD